MQDAKDDEEGTQVNMYERPDINMCGLGLQHEPFVQFTDMIVPPKAERRPEW